MASSKLGPAQGESCRTRCLLMVCMVLCCLCQPSEQQQQYRVTTTTTGREHGDDGIEQAGAGTR
ncbi:hypothetical protein PF006_g8890 [Phytophthora fragariae]|nr:hypothetical protein PF003_g11380 [Phytophthora fragariae]KAE9146343.1 hypothetical protein PF006_g8890 [Phytophthora fragariae]